MSASGRPPGGSERPDLDPDLDARLARYLRDAPERAPAPLLGASAQRVHATPQRGRGWRIGPTMSGWAVVAAVVAIAVIASVRWGFQPDIGVPGSEKPTPILASIGPGREAVVVQRIATSTVVMAVFVVDGASWAVLVDGLVLRFDPATGEVLSQVDAQLDEPTNAAAGGGAIWVGSAEGDLVKVDLASGTIETEVAVGVAHHAVAAGDDAVWVAGTSEARRIDATTLDVTPFGLPAGVVDLEAVGDEVWATYPGGRIVVADGRTGTTRTTLQVTPDAGQPGGLIAVGASDVWVAEPADGGPVHRIDPVGPAVRATIGFGAATRPSALAVDDAGVWVLFGDAGVLVRMERETQAVVDVVQVGLGAQGIGRLPGGLGLWGGSGIRVLEVAAGT